MTASRRTARTFAWAAAIVVNACSPYSHTTRIVDGREVEGRPISEDAYAAYLWGAKLEAEGDTRGALHHFARARDYDPESVAVQTALARVLCRLSPGEADAEFETALEHDLFYEPAHRERARCALSRKRPAAALKYAERAVLSEPFAYSSTEVMVEVLVALGRKSQAKDYLDAFLASHPEHPRALERRALLLSSPEAGRPEHASTSISAALRDGSDQLAIDIALRARLSRVQLARLALAAGRPDFALSQSQTVLFADPKNSDARITALRAASILADGRAYRASVKDRSDLHDLPSPRGALDLAQLLEERVGQTAAETFLDAYARRVSESNVQGPASPPPPHLHYLELKKAEDERSSASPTADPTTRPSDVAAPVPTLDTSAATP